MVNPLPPELFMEGGDVLVAIVYICNLAFFALGLCPQVLGFLTALTGSFRYFPQNDR